MEMEPGKLFIGGISWDTNEDILREYFQNFGEVVEAVIMKDRATGRARGFGFIVFADPAIAERVVKEKHMIDGRNVEAKKAVPRDDQRMLNGNNGSIQGSPGPACTKKIFVGGLASTVTENDFKNYFDQFGTITDIVVIYDHNTHRPRGFGFITYDSEDAVDKAMHKTFHELKGKMVEVKRAVPKELSLGPTRSQLGGYGYGVDRVRSSLSAYTPGFNPSSVGGYGVKVDGRYSPVTVGQSGYPPFSLSGFGVGLNFESRLSPNYRDGGNFNSDLGYGHGLNPLYSVHLNRYGSPTGYGVGSGRSGSVLSSTSRNMWGNGSFNYPANSTDSMGLESGSSVGAFGSVGAIWGSSPGSGQGGGTGSTFSSCNVTYGSAENNLGSSGGGYGRNSVIGMAPMLSYAGTNDVNDRSLGNFFSGGSFYGDPTWRSSSPELERSGSGSFAYGFGNAASDGTPRNPIDFVGNYSVTNRPNRGIAV
ncbi:unnamed protein product [Ilex paraguariensis]|uniref:RRM domain-containing protein n=1 Tax=Ilex paraguariensis TaxID=185542 RepID=A0ABC8UN31_9AQUA